MTVFASRIGGEAGRGRSFTFFCDGREIAAYPGETVATALLAAGLAVFRRTEKAGEPRGLFCGMGICFECRMEIDGRPNHLGCQTPATPGMRVNTLDGRRA